MELASVRLILFLLIVLLLILEDRKLSLSFSEFLADAELAMLVGAPSVHLVVI